jgi:hypothetical protein
MTFHTPGTNTAPPGLLLNLPPAGNGATIDRQFGFYQLDVIAKGYVILEWQNELVLPPKPVPSVEVEFKKHERKWKRDTRYTSSLTERFLHPSYARIIGLGWPAVSLILRSLEREPNDWFYALRAITGADPVSATDIGYMAKMTKAWLNWGQQRGLL